MYRTRFTSGTVIILNAMLVVLMACTSNSGEPEQDGPSPSDEVGGGLGGSSLRLADLPPGFIQLVSTLYQPEEAVEMADD